VIQFQIPPLESVELQQHLQALTQIEKQIRQLEKQMDEIARVANTAFRSAWRGAVINHELIISEGASIPELIDLQSGKMNVDIKGNIAVINLPEVNDAELE
jgi:hypothetical protein